MDLSCSSSTPPPSMAVSSSFHLRLSHSSPLPQPPRFPPPPASENPPPFLCSRHPVFHRILPRRRRTPAPAVALALQKGPALASKRSLLAPPDESASGSPHSVKQLSAAERRHLEDLLRSSPQIDPRDLSEDSTFLRGDRICETDDSAFSEPGPSLHWLREKLGFLSNLRVRGILLLNLLTFLYGSNIPVIKEAQVTTDPWLFLIGRFTLATVAFLPSILQGIKDREVRNAGMELGMWISMGYLMQSLSLLTTEAGHASFISAFTVIVVPLLAGLSGTNISKTIWVSSGVALLGIGFLESGDFSATIGDLWSLFSAVLFGVHMLRTEHYSRAVQQRKCLPVIGIQLLVMTTLCILWSVLSASLVKGSISFINLQGIDPKSLWKNVLGMPWVPMVYTGIGSTALCLWIEMSAMRDISAIETAIIYSLEPLWGALFSWCFLGERWGIMGWFGAFLILGGSMTVQLSRAQEEIKGRHTN